jgi:Zn-dependent metalloprotease
LSESVHDVSADAALNFLDKVKALYLMDDPKRDLIKSKQSQDRVGNRFFTLQQTYRGVPIFGGSICVHFSKDSYIYRITSHYKPGINLDVKPKISVENAVKAAIKDAIYGELEENFNPGLIIFKKDGKWHLAWNILINDIRHARMMCYIVNAENGSVLFKYNTMMGYPSKIDVGSAAKTIVNMVSEPFIKIKNSIISRFKNGHVYPPLQPKAPMTRGWGYGYYSGWGDVLTYEVGPGIYQLRDVIPKDIHDNDPDLNYEIIVYDLNEYPFPSIQQVSLSKGSICADNDNQWETCKKNPDASLRPINRKDEQGAELDVYRFLSEVSHYFKTHFGQVSINRHPACTDKALDLIAGAHFTYIDSSNQIRNDNSFFIPSKNFMVFGDGDSSVLDYLTTKDVVAHEFTHGVTTYSAGLFEFSEHGAMHEAFSAIFAMFITGNPESGKEMILDPNYDCGYSLSHPSSARAILRLSDNYLKQDDSLGTGYVYDPMIMAFYPIRNMGPVIYAAYLMTYGGQHDKTQKSVSPLDADLKESIKVSEQLWYHALTCGLHQGSTFNELRCAILYAVEALYKSDPRYSHFMSTVNTAFDVVGIIPLNPCIP